MSNTRETYVARFPSLVEAVAFEEYVLGAVDEHPEAETAAYWQWLGEQHDAQGDCA